MIVDLDLTDPEYVQALADHGFTYPTVMLDGQPIKYCQVADTEKGYVVRPLPGPDSGFTFDRKAEEWVMETLHGKVELVWPARAAGHDRIKGIDAW